MRAERIADHVMHVERYEVPQATADLVASGRPVVAVGTTVVRALESAATGPRQVATGPRETRLFIHPDSGHTLQVVDHLVTNFHLPESTLLMLVCAFAGTEPVLAAYRHAVAAGYRFFSYGDAMFLSRAGHERPPAAHRGLLVRAPRHPRPRPRRRPAHPARRHPDPGVHAGRDPGHGQGDDPGRARGAADRRPRSSSATPTT